MVGLEPTLNIDLTGRDKLNGSFGRDMYRPLYKHQICREPVVMPSLSVSDRSDPDMDTPPNLTDSHLDLLVMNL
ncbi:hypothetical protein RRG08_036451 [Elysia crispata]|uniref:Uncharacterized protein n=1 Tax=Elysia crispata TaxID=231223 RepID=A0AAE1DHK7_9GAST|nr:hypothetical protein RRG08_036451 [Elysia crispata]